MKKLIIALGIGTLVLFGCTEQEAEAIEVQNNINVSAGDLNAGFDQDGNEFSVGFGAFSFNQSDTVDVGVEVSLTLLFVICIHIQYYNYSFKSNNNQIYIKLIYRE